MATDLWREQKKKRSRLFFIPVKKKIVKEVIKYFDENK